MKTLIVVISSLLILYNLSYSQLKVASTGKVKIGATTDPSAILDIKGNSYTSHFYYGAAQNTYLRPGLSSGKVIFDVGNVGVGATDPLATFCVGTNGGTYSKSFFYNSSITDLSRTLQVNQKTDGVLGNQQLFGIVSYVDYGSAGIGAKLYGIYSSAYRGSTPNSTRTFGVVGTTGNGASGYNYGVFGALQGTQNGSGVYGSDSYYEQMINGKYAGYFKGDVHITGNLTVTGTYPGSDIRLKKDIRNIDDDVLSKLSQLHAVRFKLKHESELGGVQLSDTVDMKRIAEELNSEIYTKDRIGLIAQELLNTFPEVLITDNSGYLRVNYDELIPVIIEAIKEQQNIIDTLNEQINHLTSISDNLKSDVISDIVDNSSVLTFAELYQNNPNPFNTDTQIKFRIPEEV